MSADRPLPGWTDAALAVVLCGAGVGQAVLSVGPDDRLGGAAWAIVLTLPIALRRRWPSSVVLALVLLGLVHATLVSSVIPFGADVLALLVAFYSAGAHGGSRRGLVVTGVALAAFWSQDALADHPPSEYFASLVLVVGPSLAGVGARRIRAQNRRLAEALAELRVERDARARDAVMAERGRIARDLHDVVGHGLSVVALQAEAADAALEVDPDRVRAPVAAILATTRTTMVEMRRLVDVMGSSDRERHSTNLVGITELVQTHTASGLAVDLSLPQDCDDVPAGVQVAAYRIVQEALTNVRKHSRAARACVRVGLDDRQVLVEVRDPGPAALDPAVLDPTPDGFGLDGIRARAASCGGRAEVGPDGPGWWLVAHLPRGGG